MPAQPREDTTHDPFRPGLTDEERAWQFMLRWQPFTKAPEHFVCELEALIRAAKEGSAEVRQSPFPGRED